MIWFSYIVTKVFSLYLLFQRGTFLILGVANWFDFCHFCRRYFLVSLQNSFSPCHIVRFKLGILTVLEQSTFACLSKIANVKRLPMLRLPKLNMTNFQKPFTHLRRVVDSNEDFGCPLETVPSLLSPNIRAKSNSFYIAFKGENDLES